MKFTPTFKTLTAVACAFAGALGLQAQMTGHYPAGVEGIKAGSLPPPGLYFRDYNLFYHADKMDGLPAGTDFNVFAYVNAPRVIWMTEKKVLGATYGMDVLLPIAATDLKVGPNTFDSFTIGDICIEPLLLGWHGDRYDLGIGYAVWAPIGDYDLANPSQPGKGFWSHMFTVGGTYYVDAEKTWALSVLNRFEIHHRNDDLKITPGASSTLEWGISKTLKPGLDAGIVGYYATQIGDDTGPGVNYNPNTHAHVMAVGPEISGACSYLGVIISARYLREFGANARSEGGTGVLTITKRF
jgi:hypothetical protein